MKKAQVKQISELLETVPVMSMKDRGLRARLIQLRVYLKRKNADITADIDETRKTVIGDRQDDVNKYFQLLNEAQEAARKGETDKVKELQDKAKALDVEKVIAEFEEAYKALMDSEMEGIKLPRTVTMEEMADVVYEAGNKDFTISQLDVFEPLFPVEEEPKAEEPEAKEEE